MFIKKPSEILDSSITQDTLQKKSVEDFTLYIDLCLRGAVYLRVNICFSSDYNNLLITITYEIELTGSKSLIRK